MYESKEKCQKTQTNKQLCLCQAIRPCFLMLKIYGFLAIDFDHIESRCRFKRSNFWMCYGFLTTIILTLNLIYNTEVLNIWSIHREKSLHVFLNNVTHIIYATYIILVTFFNLIHTSRYVNAFNHIVPLLNHGLLCQSALRTILNLQYAIMGVVICGVAIQATTVLWLNYSSGFSDATFDFYTFASHMIQNTTYGLYTLFACICSLISGSFACFQKLVISILKHQRVYLGGESIEAPNNFQRFLGVYKYKLCNEEHLCDEALLTLKQQEILEYLRCLHEGVSLVQYEMNACLDRQLLLHLIAELVVMIINYYAVVIYFVYDFTTPLASTINFLNCLYVFLHTLGIFSLLLMPQYVHNMVKGLIPLLLEFSTSITTPEEHLQLRIFATKLKQHRLFTASGVVTIDLSNAASVCANILTYVLVALQFQVSNT